MIRLVKIASLLSPTPAKGPNSPRDSFVPVEGYDLEALEPRVLMSANGLPLDADLDAPVAATVVESGKKDTSGKKGNGGGNGGGGQPGGGDSSGPDRAVWIWGDQVFDLLDDSQVRTDSLSFFADKGVTTVYLYSGPFFGGGRYPLVDTPGDYAALVSDLHSQGIEVYGLLDSLVVDVNDSDTVIDDHFQNVLSYNSSRPDIEQLDGMNFDIEPWANRDLGWNDATREGISQQYLELAQELSLLRDQAGSDLVLGPAMPFWFDSFSVEWNGQTLPMNEHTQSAYDYATVMNFRDTAGTDDGLIAHAQNEIDFGNLIGKKVVIGVETNDVADADNPEKVTFFEEGEREMERQLSSTARAFRRDASFAGFAIQDFAGYVALAGADISLSSFSALVAWADASPSTTDSLADDDDTSNIADLLGEDLQLTIVDEG